mmetsp:Transcript_41818/g.126599  ORF Transcript_41818/g.126599 Transcript_41818/m.126599 type:complete len:212 (-) Transcript_41818:248-883(-)
MPARALKGVVVVVPALAEGQDPDEPVVHGVVRGVPVLEAPDVAHGVNSPGDVPDPGHAGEEAPEHARQASKGVEADDGQDYGVQHVGLLQETVEPLRGEVRGVELVAAHPRALRVKEPTHVGPPEAVERRVHVPLRLGAAMVVPVRGHPIDGVALQCQGAAVGEEVFEHLGRLEGAVGQLPVVRERDAEEAGDDVARPEAAEGLPREEEGC